MGYAPTIIGGGPYFSPPEEPTEFPRYLGFANETDLNNGSLSWLEAAGFDPTATQQITGDWDFTEEVTFDNGIFVDTGNIRIGDTVDIQQGISNVARLRWSGSIFRNCIGVSSSNLVALAQWKATTDTWQAKGADGVTDATVQGTAFVGSDGGGITTSVQDTTISSQRLIKLSTVGVPRWQIDNNRSNSLQPVTDNTYDLGSSDNRVHSGYFAEELTVTDSVRIDQTNISGNTGLLLYDNSTSQYQRVRIGSDGSGPNGVGRALYIDSPPVPAFSYTRTTPLTVNFGNQTTITQEPDNAFDPQQPVTIDFVVSGENENGWQTFRLQISYDNSNWTNIYNTNSPTTGTFQVSVDDSLNGNRPFYLRWYSEDNDGDGPDTIQTTITITS